jgi:hypothetical protein
MLAQLKKAAQLIRRQGLLFSAAVAIFALFLLLSLVHVFSSVAQRPSRARSHSTPVSKNSEPFQLLQGCSLKPFGGNDGSGDTLLATPATPFVTTISPPLLSLVRWLPGIASWWPATERSICSGCTSLTPARRIANGLIASVIRRRILASIRKRLCALVSQLLVTELVCPACMHMHVKSD